MKKRIFKKKLKYLLLVDLVTVWLSSNSIKDIKIIEKELDRRDFTSIVSRGETIE